MMKLKKETMNRYSCSCCSFYCDKWTCSLDECFLDTEKKQAILPKKVPVPAARWDVIR